MSAKIMGMVWDLILTPAKQQVLLALADHADHDGKNVRPGVPFIAWKTGYSDRQVQRVMRALETDGILVKIMPVKGHPTIYEINLSAGVMKQPYERRAAKSSGDKMSSLEKQGVTSAEKQESAGGDIASPVLSRNHKREPKERDSATTEVAVVPVKRERKRDPMFDAVALHIFGTTDENIEGGRVGQISSWLNGKIDHVGTRRFGFISKPANIEHVEQFAIFCKTNGYTPPSDVVKFVENWRKWADPNRKMEGNRYGTPLSEIKIRNA